MCPKLRFLGSLTSIAVSGGLVAISGSDGITIGQDVTIEAGALALTAPRGVSLLGGSRTSVAGAAWIATAGAGGLSDVMLGLDAFFDAGSLTVSAQDEAWFRRGSILTIGGLLQADAAVCTFPFATIKAEELRGSCFKPQPSPALSSAQ